MTSKPPKPRRASVQATPGAPPQQAGQAAEVRALRYLQTQGLTLQQQNFRCRFGEIDLIMRDGDALVFVEVRQRQNGRYGGALASVTQSKQHKLLATARFFLQAYPTLPACRFDVVAIEGERLHWLKNVIEE